MTEASYPSRRQLLARPIATLRPVEVHLASLVVHVRPEAADSVAAVIAAMPGVEIHARTVWKMVVTVETASEDGILAAMTTIGVQHGVMSTALAYHHAEPAGDAAVGEA